MEPRNLLEADADLVLAMGKATVGVGHGDCAGESAGVREHGMPGYRWAKELGKPVRFSHGE